MQQLKVKRKCNVSLVYIHVSQKHRMKFLRGEFRNSKSNKEHVRTIKPFFTSDIYVKVVLLHLTMMNVHFAQYKGYQIHT